MKNIYLLLLLLLGASCNSHLADHSKDTPATPSSISITEIDSFPMPTSIRALEVINDETVWFAGSGGVYGYTQNGGKDWVVDSLLHEGERPHFRAIATTKEAVFVLSIASPALLFKTSNKGKDWELVYQEDHPEVFYDAMAFWNEQYGIAMGDPTDGCLSVILTSDGGNTWKKVSCDNIPAAAEGEAAFAASNSNVALAAGGLAWMASGGKRARVYHSTDYGRHWEVYNTPVVEGRQMTGIFSLAFYDDQQGFVIGGDWEQKDQNSKNKAYSKDGGKTWLLSADGKGPGYRSCVQYMPQLGGKGMLACGIPGLSYSPDGGISWQALSDLSFYTLRFGDSWDTVWLAGNEKVAKIHFVGI
jgi:photosystem II stability/assembly factor-like uncharacterized protein